MLQKRWLAGLRVVSPLRAALNPASSVDRICSQYELACTTLLRGIISITPFQPIIVRLRPGGEPQLALDVKGFNTKMMGGDVLYFQSTKELALEPWARDWSRRIAQCVHKSVSRYLGKSRWLTASDVGPVRQRAPEALQRCRPRRPDQEYRDIAYFDGPGNITEASAPSR